MATDGGPGSNNAVLDCPNAYGTLCGPGNAGIEMHVGNPSSGINPLPPSAAPYVDPGVAGYSANVLITAKNQVVAGVQFTNPA